MYAINEARRQQEANSLAHRLRLFMSIRQTDRQIDRQTWGSLELG